MEIVNFFRIVIRNAAFTDWAFFVAYVAFPFFILNFGDERRSAFVLILLFLIYPLFLIGWMFTIYRGVQKRDREKR